jgi:hypothetical protein
MKLKSIIGFEDPNPDCTKGTHPEDLFMIMSSVTGIKSSKI